jgi:hypothetical protein
MGIHYEQTKIHWNYFLAIQQDFELISRYIEFTEENNKTFSIELARIIMSSSQEIDVVMKRICNLLGVENTENINDYRKVIKEKLPELIDEKIFIAKYGMKSQPWQNWSGDSNPIWWKANNLIKHQRTEHFKEANLQNAFNSLGALLIVNFYFYKLEKENKTKDKISPKDVTRELDCKNSFIKLQDNYYNGYLLLE